MSVTVSMRTSGSLAAETDDEEEVGAEGDWDDDDESDEEVEPPAAVAPRPSVDAAMQAVMYQTRTIRTRSCSCGRLSSALNERAINRAVAARRVASARDE